MIFLNCSYNLHSNHFYHRDGKVFITKAQPCIVKILNTLSFSVFVSYNFCNDISRQHRSTRSFRQGYLSAPPGSSREVHVDVVDQLPGVRWQLHF